MSYDLYSFGLGAGQDPAEALDRLESASIHELSAQPVGDRDRSDRRLVEAIRETDPSFELEPSEDAGSAAIVLTCPELEIGLRPTHASISIPYWDSIDRVSLARRLALVIDVLGRVAGYVTYDPQLEEIVEANRNLGDVLAAFEEGVRRLAELADPGNS